LERAGQTEEYAREPLNNGAEAGKGKEGAFSAGNEKRGGKIK
jgi:hypothetical protein